MVLNVTKRHGKNIGNFKFLNYVFQILPCSKTGVDITLMKRTILMHLAHKLKTAFMKLDICGW